MRESGVQLPVARAERACCTAQPPNPANPPNTAKRRSRSICYLAKSSEGDKRQGNGQAGVAPRCAASAPLHAIFRCVRPDGIGFERFGGILIFAKHSRR